MREPEWRGKEEPEDLDEVMIAGSKAKLRVKALILVAVFLFVSLVPPPWNAFAPVLLIVLLIVALAERLRRRTRPTLSGEDEFRPPEPYSAPPRHAGDPRRYRPIE